MLFSKKKKERPQKPICHFKSGKLKNKRFILGIWECIKYNYVYLYSIGKYTLIRNLYSSKISLYSQLSYSHNYTFYKYRYITTQFHQHISMYQTVILTISCTETQYHRSIIKILTKPHQRFITYMYGWIEGGGHPMYCYFLINLDLYNMLPRSLNLLQQYNIQNYHSCVLT